MAAKRKLFVNVAVADLNRAVDFFTGLGFEFDPNFTDETAACMLIGEDAYAMLLVRERFQDFTRKPVADSTAQTETILALSAESRDEVDVFADKALALGGSPANEPVEMDFLYSRSFQDPDGHEWEILWMDPAGFEQESEAVAAQSPS